MSNEMVALAECSFGSGTIRMFGSQWEPWFVGKDVCDALGYKNSRDAIARHVDPEDKNTVVFRDGKPGNPETTIINESGMYALIFGSELPEAKKFKRWVTHEVLPNIRRYGYYDPEVEHTGTKGRPQLTLEARHRRREANRKHWLLANGEEVNRDQVRVYCLDLGATLEFASKRDVEAKIKFIDKEMAERGIESTKELWRFAVR